MIRSGIALSVLTLLASLLGFLTQLVVARHFGAGASVDAYLASMSLPLFVSGSLAAWFSYSVVPEVLRLEMSPDAQRGLIAVLWRAAITLALGLFVVAAVLFFHIGLGGAFGANASLAKLYGVAWSIAGVQVLASMGTAILNGLRAFVPAALIALLPYLGMLLALTTLADHGIVVQAYGMLGGTVGTLFLGWVLVRRRGRSGGDVGQEAIAKLKLLLRSAPFAAIALSCFSAYSVIDAYWAPRAGEAVLSHLGYAQRIVVAVGSIVAAGPSAFLVPRLTAALRDGDVFRFNKLVRSVLLWLTVGSVGAAFAVLPFSERIVEALFVRGAFSTADAHEVARCLLTMTPGVIAMLLIVITMRAIFCIPQGARHAVRISVLWVFLYAILSGVLYRYGAPGIGLGYSVTWLLVACYSWRVLQQLVQEACNVA